MESIELTPVSDFFSIYIKVKTQIAIAISSGN
jgi:hypothetical protein